MRDIETWLSSDGIPAKLGGFTAPLKRFPCRVILDRAEYRGDDQTNRLVEHEVTLELYNDWDKDNYRKEIIRSERMTEALLNAAGYEFLKRSSVPLKSERMWETVYEFTFIERLED